MLKRKKYLPLLAVSIIVLAILAVFLSNQPEENLGCQTNTDCVPATCCHSTACVPSGQAPNCDGVACTMECRGGTLDCSGSCACEAGQCIANIEGAQIANPASVFCEANNYTLDIRTSAGGQYGVCMFPDGSECDEWQFFRGECTIGMHQQVLE